MREHPDIHLVRNPNYRSADALYSLDLALRGTEPHSADEGLFISNGECIYDDKAIERVSRVFGSAIVGDSSHYGAAATKVIAEDGDVVFRSVQLVFQTMPPPRSQPACASLTLTLVAC